jgi:hypothetical protein
MAIIPADEKVFMVDKRTNTVYGGSQALQDMQQWYTMQDVADSVQPYKVFTALLTQSGGDGPNNEWSSGSGTVPVGITFEITGNDGGTADFTNIGSPNNEVGTFFVSTGGNPNNWGVSDNGTLGFNTGAPVATVLENTIGNIWFTYSDVGIYNINSSGLFTNTKTINTIDQTGNICGTNDQPYYVYCGGDTNYLELLVIDTGLDRIDGYLYNKLIEIRVYN